MLNLSFPSSGSSYALYVLACVGTKTLIETLYLTYHRHKMLRFQQQNPMIRETHESTNEMDHIDDKLPRRLRKAETVLQRRTSRIILVLEASCDMFNHQAVLRTAECLGIQHVYIVEPAFYKEQKQGRRISREALDWLTIRRFSTTQECIQTLNQQNYEIWSTDLSQEAFSLESSDLELPERVAIVIGREADGVSEEMLQASSKKIYLPLHGFADSLNLNVAAALVLQHIFWRWPDARGKMSVVERKTLRQKWYEKVWKDKPSSFDNDNGTKSLKQWVESPPPVYSDLRRPLIHRTAWVSTKIKKRIENKEQELKKIGQKV